MEDGGWKIPGATSNIQHSTFNIQIGKYVVLLACLIAAGLCGVGLFKSYSRGAWLGTAVGLGYLAYQVARQKRKAEGGKRESTYLTPALTPRPTGGEGEAMPSSTIHPPSSNFDAWLGKNRFSLAVILISVAVLAFWQFRFSEARPVQRIFSANNPNDFSWRNRVMAWQGAGRMMMDRPLTGFGWGEAETVYGKKYCPTNESAAIEMNDYLMIGISAGVPAMICFLVYILLGLRGKTGTGWKHYPTSRVAAEVTRLNLKAETSQSLLTSAATPQEANPETGATHCPTLPQPSAILHSPPSWRQYAVPGQRCCSSASGLTAACSNCRWRLCFGRSWSWGALHQSG